MPESPEEFWERTHGALRPPPVEEWDTWPFVGAVQPRPLLPPQGADLPRQGERGVGCTACAQGVDGALWHDDRWIVRPLPQPSGLPCVVLLYTREHLDFHELPEELQAELGPLLVRIQRAVYAIGDIGNVHVLRIGDGSEHCHVWFMARPTGIHQLQSGFAQIWDDVLPPLPADVWRANLEIVGRELADAPRKGV